MGVSIYDKEVLKKIKGWVNDEKLKITGPDETRQLFQYRADMENDKPIELPLITIRRQPSVEILSLTKKPLTFDGWKKNNNGERGDKLNAIPIKIDYQLDIYTRYMEEAEEYVREFIFKIINNPELHIQIPYNNSNIEHVSNIRLLPDISDNSDVPERIVVGEFTRKTLSFYIDDAYLFDYRTKVNSKIEISCSDIEAKIENEE